MMLNFWTDINRLQRFGKLVLGTPINNPGEPDRPLAADPAGQLWHRLDQLAQLPAA